MSTVFVLQSETVPWFPGFLRLGLCPVLYMKLFSGSDRIFSDSLFLRQARRGVLADCVLRLSKPMGPCRHQKPTALEQQQFIATLWSWPNYGVRQWVRELPSFRLRGAGFS